MFNFDVIFKANSSVIPLNVNSDKMIFAVPMETQTFIRYVAADGTSMILHSFDYKANFINASLSFDFRLLHLTEQIEEDGKMIYSSKIYDVQNPLISSKEIKSPTIIKGDFEGITCYNIIYLFKGKISHYSVTFQDNSIILSNNKIKVKTNHVMWTHYSASKNKLSVLSKSGDKFIYYYDYLNLDNFLVLKSIDEKNLYQKYFYSASFHGNFCLIEQCFLSDSDYDQIHAHFINQDKMLAINIPKIPNGTRMNCIQYYSIIFAFVPNVYICIIDFKKMKAVYFTSNLAKMPVSPKITVYDEGIVCDNLKGIVYSTKINLNCLKHLSNLEEIRAATILVSKIKCINYFCIDKEENDSSENFDVLNDQSEYNKVQGNDGFVHFSSLDNNTATLTEIFSDSEKGVKGNSDCDNDDSNSSDEESIKGDLDINYNQTSKNEGNSNENDNKNDKINDNESHDNNNNSDTIINDKNDSDEKNNSNENENDNQNENENDNKNDNRNGSNNNIKNSSSGSDTNLSINPRKNGIFDTDNFSLKKALSSDLITNAKGPNSFENASDKFKRMLGKSIINKSILSHIFSFLNHPLQIVIFADEFINLWVHQNPKYSIPTLYAYVKPHYSLTMRLPQEVRKELSLVEAYFPTTGICNHYEVFKCHVKSMMEEKSSLSLNEVYQKSMDIIRKQNSLVLNLKEALLMWDVSRRNTIYRKFLVSFCLYSELSLMNLPQIPEIKKVIVQYSKLYFSKEMREQMTAFGIYGIHISDFSKNDIKYWKNRIDAKGISDAGQNGPKQANGKNKDKKLFHTFTVPYFKIRNQKVFYVHHYSHIP